jgi:ABC-type branched-subunit amino acid transport system permease subunit
MMHTSKTVEVLAVAYIGGRGSLWGGAAIAFPFIFAMELVRSSLTNLPGLNLLLYGPAVDRGDDILPRWNLPSSLTPTFVNPKTG